jgi:hypothetical protein
MLVGPSVVLKTRDYFPPRVVCQTISVSSRLGSRAAPQEQARARKEKKRAASKGSLLCGGRMVIEKAIRESQVISKISLMRHICKSH